MGSRPEPSANVNIPCINTTGWPRQVIIMPILFAKSLVNDERVFVRANGCRETAVSQLSTPPQYVYIFFEISPHANKHLFLLAMSGRPRTIDTS